jgi:hypothetical protein
MKIMRRAAILAVALLVATSTGASADKWQRFVCSGAAGVAGGAGPVQPALRFTFNMTTMTWSQGVGGNENNVLTADDRDFHLATVDRLNENNHTEYSLNKTTLRMEDESTGAVYRCQRDTP